MRGASRLLGVSHSAISRHLGELQGWLGVDLVVRTPGSRAIAFSEEGEMLGRAGIDCLEALQAAVSEVREARGLNAVLIDTTPSVAVRWLLPRLAPLERAHPRIELSIVTERRPRGPEERGRDLSIRMGCGPWPGFDCTPLMDDALVPIASPACWERLGAPTEIDGLTRCRLLHDRDPNASWALWREAVGLPALDVRRGPRFASSDLVLRAAEQGLGVALARERLARDSLALGLLLSPFPQTAVPLEAAYWLLRPQHARERTVVRDVQEWLLTEGAR